MNPSDTHRETVGQALRRASLVQLATGLLTAGARRRLAGRTRARPRLEGLEDRCLLSPTITEFPTPTASSDPGGSRRVPTATSGSPRTEPARSG